MNTLTQPSNAEPIPPFTPGAATESAFFEAAGKPRVERNRFFLVSLVLAVGYPLMGAAFMTLLPLKTVETYLVHKADGGRAVADGTPLGTWSPDRDMISYFVNDWARNVFDINPSTITLTTSNAMRMTVGTATEQLSEHRRKDNPYALLNEAPGTTRTYEHKSINFLSDNTVLLRFNTDKRRPGQRPEIKAYALSATFTRNKPTSSAEILRNPAGLYITNFSLSEEAVSPQ